MFLNNNNSLKKLTVKGIKIIDHKTKNIKFEYLDNN